MRHTPSGTGFSATDLSAFLECGHRTLLELAVLDGKLERPGENEIERRLLELRGLEHERRVLELYRSSGRTVVTITAQPGADGFERASVETLEAMRSGADVIYQAALSRGAWSGRPDFLVKVSGGRLFGHHYEVVDAKLSRELKARAVLQLCVYTDHLTEIQGVAPRHFHIAAGGDRVEPVPLFVADYMAYYRALHERFERFVAPESKAPTPYPEPVAHCDVCPWWKRCEERRRADDHLSLVAGITRRQRDRLSLAGVERVSELGVVPRELSVAGIASESLRRVREQARLQLEARATNQPKYELLVDAPAGTGLEALPAPTPGDLFLDLEGDAFVQGGGLEYLFGLLDFGEPLDDFIPRDARSEPRYHAFWATDAASEKRAFEAVIDRIVRGRGEFHALHVYHFGHRESDAVKKLSCRHKTREAEVDHLLRNQVFVDLHPIVRHGLRASVESYTLKELERLHGFRRETNLRDAARAMQLFGWWLETQAPDLDVPALRARIEAYNRDDCLSTSALRDWLEARRPELEKLSGRTVTRPSAEPKPENEERLNKSELSARLAQRLLAGLPSDPSTDNESERARRLMADLLDWHWREAKSGWWEYHRARLLSPVDRLEDRAVLGGLEHAGAIGKVKRSVAHRYTFPAQEHAIRSKPEPIDPATQKSAGTLLELGPEHLVLKRGASAGLSHPQALVPGKPIGTSAQEQSLLAIAESIVNGSANQYPAAQELLLRAAPRLGQAPGAPLLHEDEAVDVGLRRLGLALDGSVLAVQGPPGSGKTHQAALLICALIESGKRVGVTATSHAVIRNVLSKVATLAGTLSVRALHLQDDAEDPQPTPFEVDDDKPKALKRLAAGELNLLGGTAWSFASEDFANSVDILVVDEAGQMSLANVISVSRAARSLILFGDPAQLEQPQKGVHPPGAEVSALEQWLGEDTLTIPRERGVFLPHTRRLHPRLCDFVSRVFYEGRLQPEHGLGLDRQAVHGPGIFQGAGLRYVPVEHRGNTNQSLEEAGQIQALVQELLSACSTFVDRHGMERPLTAKDILVVAPYNAQVVALKRALPSDVRVGTVDKFQGQEAPVVVYSMTTSSAEDAPRGLEFLYSLNRLNVAISRAQALAVLVASPELTHVACKTPRQMKLVNALCAYLEMASDRTSSSK